MNDAMFLFRMFLNHSVTACEFFHWLTWTEERTSLLILSRITLLTFPMANLDGLISRHDIACRESECYITANDHKEDFPHKISCRLINPSN